MFITMRKYSGTTSRDEAVRRVEEGLVPLLSECAGFVTYYAAEFENGDIGGISIFETKEDSDNAAEKTRNWVQENLAEIMPNAPEVTRGEVLIHATPKGIGQTA